MPARDLSVDVDETATLLNGMVPPPAEELPQGPRTIYMVMVNEFSGCVFVKDLDYFRSQGGFDWESDPWGRHWFPVVATSIENARREGCKHPSAKPYDRQAK